MVIHKSAIPWASSQSMQSHDGSTCRRWPTRGGMAHPRKARRQRRFKRRRRHPTGERRRQTKGHGGARRGSGGAAPSRAQEAAAPEAGGGAPGARGSGRGKGQAPNRPLLFCAGLGWAGSGHQQADPRWAAGCRAERRQADSGHKPIPFLLSPDFFYDLLHQQGAVFEEQYCEKINTKFQLQNKF